MLIRFSRPGPSPLCRVSVPLGPPPLRAFLAQPVPHLAVAYNVVLCQFRAPSPTLFANWRALQHSPFAHVRPIAPPCACCVFCFAFPVIPPFFLCTLSASISPLLFGFAAFLSACPRRVASLAQFFLSALTHPAFIARRGLFCLTPLHF